MRTFVSVALAAIVAAAGIPSTLLAQATPRGATLKGTAYTTDLQPLSGAKVQIRNIKTGELTALTTTGQAGDFSFQTLQPGSYIVEVVDSHGKVVGMTAPFMLTAGVAAAVSVVAVSSGAVSSGSSAGLSILGLGPLTSLAVLGAAGAAAVTAVVSTRPDASPSR